MTDTATLPRCGLLRRLAAILYDTLLLAAVLVVATIPSLFLIDPKAPTQEHPILTIWLFLVSFFFFAWFWIHGGQTLGMRAWRIKIQTRDGQRISWWQAMLRFLVAMASWGALGLGFLWSLVDKEKMTWHDRYSETVLVLLPRK